MNVEEVIAPNVATSPFAAPVPLAAAVPFVMPLTRLPPKGGVVTSGCGVLSVYSNPPNTQCSILISHVLGSIL